MTHSRSSLHCGAVCVITAVFCMTVANTSVAQEMAKIRCRVVDSSMAPTEVNRSKTELVEEVYALLDAWREALREGDVEAVAALVTEDAEFWSNEAAPLIGRAALGDAFRPFFTDYQLLQEFECHELVLRDDLAFMRGLERNRMVPHSGGETMEIEQRAFSVMRRGTDGRWRFARGMTNEPPTQ